MVHRILSALVQDHRTETNHHDGDDGASSGDEERRRKEFSLDEPDEICDQTLSSFYHLCRAR
ncbi:hypothetical protein [Paraburkholderia nemoris]|uniref:hypothetical protein n=1 Tax=Paraburkholderia nemoris TaxID=2793076 RepID=UPI001F2A5AAA|nr:hypothetical protein [Paraburkholderia nemoris]